MTRERIEDIREIVLPFVRSVLLKTNYERLGKSDAEEFTRDFNEILDLAIKALEQEPVLEKIYADIQRLRGCSCSCSDGIIDDVEDILDKYKAEQEET